MKKNICIKQRDISDCGAACLASVAAYFGFRIPVSRIRQYSDTGKAGTSIQGLLEGAEKLNLRAKAVKVSGITSSSIPLPSIFHQVLDNGIQHFVVVYKISGNRVRLMDPAEGKLVYMPWRVFKKTWTGVLLLLIPADNFRQGDERKSVYIRFWQLVKPHRKTFLKAILGASIYTILGLSMSVYVEKIIDIVLPDANRQLLNLLGPGMILLLCFQVTMGYMKSLIALQTGQQIDARLILGYFRHLLELPQRFFDNMRIGEIISRVNDALRIRIFINDISLGLIVSIFTLLFSISAMFFYNRKLAMLMLGAIPFYIVIYRISNHLNAKWQRKIMESSALLENQLVESIQGMTTIRRFNAQEYFNLKTESRLNPLMRSIYSGSHAGLKISNTTEWLTSLFTIALLWVGSYMVIDHYLSPGELISFYTLSAFFTGPVQTIIGVNKQLQDALIAAERLFEIIDLETEKDSRAGQTLDFFPDGDLIFRDIYFSYGPGNRVFNGMNLRIPASGITGLVGDSGSGKSTILALLQGLYSPGKGNILIGETDIQYINLTTLRQGIAAVPQHADLFQGSILFNITLRDESPDLQRIFDICKRLGLHEFIDKLPDRYQTQIRDQGNNLSGGQKQRLAIARALYRDPEILVMDEATSALDPESEQKVLETIRWFHNQKKTIIIIAHRLSMVLGCDTIGFLKGGTLAACGSHEMLIKENPDYAAWWKWNHP